MRRTILGILLLCVIGIGGVMAHDGANTDIDSIAENPEVLIRYSLNQIDFNGADWDSLRMRFKNSCNEPFTIVHIGDSHIQPDITTGVVRQNMQARFGDAGRGLIIPYKLASTNEPRDYRITLDCRYNGTRLLKTPWSLPMAMTGISVDPLSRNYKLKIEDLRENGDPFRFVRLYVSQPIDVVTAESTYGWISFNIDPNDDEGYYDIFLSEPQSEITLGIKSPKDAILHGVFLGNEKPGIFYHTIGNNGATYEIYTRIGNFGQQLSTLYPDLVIISMGTNEAYNNVDPADMERHVAALVDDIIAQNPDVVLLLTTPKECQRRIKGRRRNAKGAYAIVNGCSTMRDAIKSFATKRHIAVYDWFEIAGGEEASNKWYTNRWLSADRVHNTNEGYEISGEIFSQALLNALESEDQGL